MSYNYVRFDLLSFYKGFGIFNLDIFSVAYKNKYSNALLSVMWDSNRKWLHVYLFWLFEFNLGNMPDDAQGN